MNLRDQPADRAGTVADLGLGVVFVATLAVEAHNVAAYHGDWPFDLAVGTVVCAAALLRRRLRVWAAAAGFAVSVAAAVAAQLWRLPGQPGIAAGLAVFLLIGSGVRTLPVRPAVAVAVGGAAVTFIAMDSHPAAAQVLGLAWGAALGAGLGLRLLNARRQAITESVRRGERLELARELHDATAHHITGLVIQAQAARIAARRHAEALDRALADLEAAGGDALTAARHAGEARGHPAAPDRSPADIRPAAEGEAPTVTRHDTEASGHAADTSSADTDSPSGNPPTATRRDGEARGQTESPDTPTTPTDPPGGDSLTTVRHDGSVRGDAGALDRSLGDIEAAGGDALSAMRRVIGLLRDGDDGGGFSPGPEGLGELVARFAGRGPVVRLLLPDGPADPGWPAEVSSTVNRVVGEALTNVARHAPGAYEVTVVLGHDREVVTVEITDAGSAGSSRFRHAGGYGLVGMRERVEALGGTLRAGPVPGGGWSVLATLPAAGREGGVRRSSGSAGRGGAQPHRRTAQLRGDSGP